MVFQIAFNITIGKLDMNISFHNFNGIFNNIKINKK